VQKVASDAVETDSKLYSFVKRNWVKIHGGALVTGWGVFEWLAPRAADHVHTFVLHIFWGDFVHKLLHISHHAAHAAK